MGETKIVIIFFVGASVSIEMSITNDPFVLFSFSM